MGRTGAVLLLAVFLFGQAPGFAAEAPEINTVLMRSTFKLAGTGSTGTSFILGKPSKDGQRAHFVLVTAAHVLANMAGEEAALSLRRKSGEKFEQVAWPIKIRDGTRPLWTTHPAADIAVMFVRLPTDADITPVSTELLATDEILTRFEVHAGDRLSCLGFPLGAQANDAGFPILRSGQVASYPLTPTKTTKTFLFDFNVFPGNSGGPVYLVDSNRAYEGNVHIGTVRFLVGLVSEQKVVNEEMKGLSETRQLRHQLGLGVVIHASLIREALDLLPAEPEVK